MPARALVSASNRRHSGLRGSSPSCSHRRFEMDQCPGRGRVRGDDRNGIALIKVIQHRSSTKKFCRAMSLYRRRFQLGGGSGTGPDSPPGNGSEAEHESYRWHPTSIILQV